MVTRRVLVPQIEGSSPSSPAKHYGPVAELADALDLGSSAARRGGSTPSWPTKIRSAGRTVRQRIANPYYLQR